MIKKRIFFLDMFHPEILLKRSIVTGDKEMAPTLKNAEVEIVSWYTCRRRLDSGWIFGSNICAG